MIVIARRLSKSFKRSRRLFCNSSMRDENVEMTPTQDAVMKEKLGTQSPWATSFDSWGANEIHNSASEEDLSLLEREDLIRIPTNKSQYSADEDEDTVDQILESYDRVLAARSSHHFGYPYNLRYDHTDLMKFMKYSINNLGDPFVTSNYGVHSRQFERSVVDFFANLWGFESRDDYWGYVTTCGTEGNLHGILLAREKLPDGVLYASRESHYSIFKAARYYRMDSESINSLPSGQINYEELQQRIAKNGDRPVIINVNIGTTVKGACDDLDRILRVLSFLDIPREKFYIHCDGALFALMLPFVQYAPQIGFNKPIDSIAVSGHKMLGCPMPCGIAVTRKEHVDRVEEEIQYLNSVDTTIMGSRNGQAPLFMWYSLKRKGIQGIKKDVQHCITTAQYLRDELKGHGITAQLNDLSCTVVLERPKEESLVKRWQLACEDDIAHVVVMPNITREKIDVFVKEFVESRLKHGARNPTDEMSPLSALQRFSW